MTIIGIIVAMSFVASEGGISEELILSILGVIGTIVGFLTAWLQRKGKEKEARLVDAIMAGVEVAGQKIVKNKIRAKAEAGGVSERLDEKLVAKGWKSSLKKSEEREG